MLTREDRLLAEFLVSRRLVSKEILESRAKQKAESSPRLSLVEMLVEHGDLHPAQGEQAVREVAAELAPVLPAGKRLGEFELVREIDRGGMGIVYEAEQESLARRVALKVLPAGVALDDRLSARFLREARAAARLSHPAIVPVFASGRAEGVLYFAMELIEGKSLGEHLEVGPLEARRAARYGISVARALDHAHRSGLVHRDVKPENILIDARDRARVTDFGLVLDARSGSGPLSHSVVGTPAYMAPEQARGQAVDARTDVYALGAVLYHALTGSAPYKEQTPAAVLARLLTEEPPPLSGNEEVPAGLAAIVDRAMSREPGDRYGSAEELACDLERFLRGEAIEASAPEVVRPYRHLKWLAAAAVFLASAMAIYWFESFRSGVESEVPGGTDQATGMLAGQLRLAIAGPGSKRTPTIHPDGSTLAYSGNDAGRWLIYLATRRGDLPEPLSEGIAGSHKAPEFAPDGKSIAFLRGGDIIVMDLATREHRTVTDRAAEGLTWSPDGSEIAYVARQLGRLRLRAVSLATRSDRLITSSTALHPQWSPQGHRIAYVSETSGSSIDVLTIPSAGGVPVRVTDDPADEWSPAWSADGRFLYFGRKEESRYDLWRVRVDERTGQALDQPEPVTRGLLHARYSIASTRESNVLALAYENRSEGLQRLPLTLDGARAGGPPQSLATGTHLARYPWPSPSNAQLLTTESPEENLWFRDLEDLGARVSLTRGSSRDRGARWSPSGESIAFHSDRTGDMEIWTIGSDGGRPRPLTRTPGRDAVYPVWSPEGDRLAYTVVGHGAFVIGVEDTDELLPLPPFPETGVVFEPWSWSADGRMLAGTARGVVIYSFERNEYRRVTDAGAKPVWTEEGRILYVRDNAVRRVDPGTRDELVLFSPAPNRLLPFLAVSIGDTYAYYSIETSDQEIWWLELDKPPERSGAQE